MPTRTTHTAGAFDIRTIIGLLLGIYGLILLPLGLFGEGAPEKTGGVNANLYAGAGLLLVGLAFLAWATLKPVVVDESTLPGHVGDGPR